MTLTENDTYAFFIMILKYTMKRGIWFGIIQGMVGIMVGMGEIGN